MAESPAFDLFLLIVIVFVIGFVVLYSVNQRKTQNQENTYLEALEHLAEGNERLAIQKLKDTVREDSENVSAYLRLGDLLRDKGLLSNAVRIHKDLTLRSGLSLETRIPVLKSLLTDYDVQRDYDKGIATAKDLLAIERKTDPEVVQKLIEMLEKSQQWKEAEETANKYMKILPEEYQQRQALYLVFQAQVLQEQDRGKDARIKMKEALKKDRHCAAAYYFLGKSYQAEDRLDEAVAQWKKLCEMVPNKAHIVYPELEKTWFEMGRYADAENLYQDQLNKDKKELRAGLALAEIYNKKGDYDNALEVLGQLEAEYPASPTLIRKKINYYFNKGQYKLAANQSLSYFNNVNGEVKTDFCCTNCQYKTQSPVWICPQCQSIDSFNS